MPFRFDTSLMLTTSSCPLAFPYPCNTSHPLDPPFLSSRNHLPCNPNLLSNLPPHGFDAWSSYSRFYCARYLRPHGIKYLLWSGFTLHGCFSRSGCLWMICNPLYHETFVYRQINYFFCIAICDRLLVQIGCCQYCVYKVLCSHWRVLYRTEIV